MKHGGEPIAWTVGSLLDTQPTVSGEGNLNNETIQK